MNKKLVAVAVAGLLAAPLAAEAQTANVTLYGRLNMTMEAVNGQALDPNLPLANIQTMNGRLGVAFLPARLAATVLGVFGLLGLVLASLGVYGVMSHAVSQRNREIGIRLAVGAASSVVVRLLMKEGMTLVGIGIGVGIAGALAGSQLLRGVLYGSGLDPITFALVPLVLGLVAVIAIWIPARRAASVNPVVVLRQE